MQNPPQKMTPRQRKEALQLRLDQELMATFDLFPLVDSFVGQRMLDQKLGSLMVMQQIINNIKIEDEEPPKKDRWKPLRVWLIKNAPWIFSIFQSKIS